MIFLMKITKPFKVVFKLTLKKELLTSEDAVDAVKIIDKVILYYTAACKK